MLYDSPEYGQINPYTLMREVQGFSLTSTDIRHGEPLPIEIYGEGAGGGNLSPQLSWSGFPTETKSFALTCFDPDAPTGSGFWHWAVANISPNVTDLARGAGSIGGEGLPAGAVMLPNELRQKAFTGANPPAGTGVHHYWFAVHALDVENLAVDPEQTPAVLGFMMRDATIARAIIVATGEFGSAA